jgi:hypothetical protein
MPLIFALISTIAIAHKVIAETPEFHLSIQDHLFNPAELVIPANTKIKLHVYNKDASSEEFESYELNREKVIVGNSKATLFIGPLKPGEYPYFGEFNQRTARGKIIAR